MQSFQPKLQVEGDVLVTIALVSKARNLQKLHSIMTNIK